MNLQENEEEKMVGYFFPDEKGDQFFGHVGLIGS